MRLQLPINCFAGGRGRRKGGLCSGRKARKEEGRWREERETGKGGLYCREMGEWSKLKGERWRRRMVDCEEGKKKTGTC